MAPTKPPKTPAPSARAAALKRSSKDGGALQRFSAKYLNFEFVKFLIFDPASLPIVTALILLAELVLNVLVIQRVPYTEIDWTAYMQQCADFLNGTTNYAQLRGDTGPLVYPAAFVYIYSALYYLTAHGQNIRLAQYFFIAIYLLQMWLVLRLYTKSRKVPPYVLVLSVFTSYRIHSIYVLRLFNDPVAVLFLYAALNLFLDRRWTWGSVCFSLGVGVKMNILLFAPALLAFYLVNLGYLKTCVQLAICAGVQLLLGAPFLLSHPWAYIRGSFDLGRIFEHKWTVNYRFLSVDVFEHKFFHLGLFAVQLALLFIFATPTLTYFKNYARLRELQTQLLPQIRRKNEELKNKPAPAAPVKKKTKNSVKSEEEHEEKLTPDQAAFLKSFEKGLQKSTGLKAAPLPQQEEEEETTAPPAAEEKVSIHFDQCTQLALLPFFLCNFIGVMCARSLHYQFYVWYFHSLPYLAWSTNFSLGARYLILGLIEFCWNTYPSSNFSSCLLHLCHLVLLIGIARNMFKTTGQSASALNRQRLAQQQQAEQLANMKPNVVNGKNSAKAKVN